MWAAQFLRPEQLARSCGLRCGAALQPVGGLRCAQGAGESLCRVCRERVATRHDSECGYGNPCDRGERDGSLSFGRWERLCGSRWQSGKRLRGEPADAVLQHVGVPIGSGRHVWTEQPRSVAWSGFVGSDVSAFKVIPVSERVKVQFRTEAFNVINHANLGNPGASVAATASYGRITSSSAPRVIQFCAASYVLERKRDPSGGGIPVGSGSG